MSWWAGAQIAAGARIHLFKIQASSGAHQASNSMGNGDLPLWLKYPGMMTTHLHPVLRIRMNGAIPLLLYTIMACSGKTLPSPYLFSQHCIHKKMLIHMKFAPLSSNRSSGGKRTTHMDKWSIKQTKQIFIPCIIFKKHFIICHINWNAHLNFTSITHAQQLKHLL